MYCNHIIIVTFQSTHPLRDATADELKEGLYCLISIHAPLTGCDDDDILRTLNIPISIHAPLTGCDIRWRFFGFTCIYFNPRTPYGMRRKSSARNTNTVVFQSTHPLRDATLNVFNFFIFRPDFNPRTPYGMRRIATIINSYIYQFQSTHPLRDATISRWDLTSLTSNFNPRTPYGMRRRGTIDTLIGMKISIHAPLTGCDGCFPIPMQW